MRPKKYGKNFTKSQNEAKKRCNYSAKKQQKRAKKNKNKSNSARKRTKYVAKKL